MRYRDYWARLLKAAFGRWGSAMEIGTSALAVAAVITFLLGLGVWQPGKWYWIGAGGVLFVVLFFVAPYEVAKDLYQQIEEFETAEDREEWQGELTEFTKGPLQEFTELASNLFYQFTRDRDDPPELQQVLEGAPFPTQSDYDEHLREFAKTVYPDGGDTSASGFRSRCEIVPGAWDREDFENFHDARIDVRGQFAGWEERRVPGSEFEEWLDDMVRPRHFRWLKMIGYFAYPLAEAMDHSTDLTDRPWYPLGLHWQEIEGTDTDDTPDM